MQNIPNRIYLQTGLELNDENSIYSEASCRFRIDELKKLIQ